MGFSMKATWIFYSLDELKQMQSQQWVLKQEKTIHWTLNTAGIPQS